MKVCPVLRFDFQLSGNEKAGVFFREHGWTGSSSAVCRSDSSLSFSRPSRSTIVALLRRIASLHFRSSLRYKTYLENLVAKTNPSCLFDDINEQPAPSAPSSILLEFVSILQLLTILSPPSLPRRSPCPSSPLPDPLFLPLPPLPVHQLNRRLLKRHPPPFLFISSPASSSKPPPPLLLLSPTSLPLPKRYFSTALFQVFQKPLSKGLGGHKLGGKKANVNFNTVALEEVVAKPTAPAVDTVCALVRTHPLEYHQVR